MDQDTKKRFERARQWLEARPELVRTAIADAKKKSSGKKTLLRIALNEMLTVPIHSAVDEVMNDVEGGRRWLPLYNDLARRLRQHFKPKEPKKLRPKKYADRSGPRHKHAPMYHSHI